MPVKHDVFQDLGISKENASQLRKQDPHLDALFKKYDIADQAVVEAEANDAIGVPDEKLVALKEKRLLIKDTIASLLVKSKSATSL